MATTSDTGTRRNKELDKFKRRMIRAVARLMLHEKMPEDEMWEKLKTETGYDCELLWRRMRSVALKKLKRMLVAEDRIDVIARMARMTVTDWLLFDLVLVHEKTDFIGTDSPRVKMGELKPLTDLFSLVQRYGIEGLSGDDLAKAWTEATLFYNSQGHHVSPMLLQKRWYQLKETTRNCFYQFWFSYRGNAKLFAKASAEYLPTMLQAAIARRFNEVVTCPFIEWEEMIQKGFVILSEEFDARLRPPKKPIDDNAPDLVLVEPIIETIDLDADSDTEASANKQNIAENTTPSKTVVKTEPIDTDEDFAAAHNLMQTYDLHEEEDTFDSEYGDTEDLDIEDSKLALLENALENDENVASLAPDVENTIPNTLNTDILTNNDIVSSTELTHEDITTQASNETVHSDNVSSTLDNGDIASRACANETDCVPPLEENIINQSVEPIETLPQITSVFGNVHISSDLPRMNALSQEINTTHDSNSDDDVQLITTSSDIDVKQEIPTMEDTPEIQEPILEARPAVQNDLQEIPITVKAEVNTLSVADIIDKTCEKALEKLIDTSVTGTSALNSVVKTEECASPFGELPNYINLVDNGIELADDGIAYVDEEMDYRNKMDKIKTEDVEDEDESKAEDTEEESTDIAKIDLKLLLYPVVYTTRLENMGVLDDPYETVEDKHLLDTILDKSKPISKKTVNFDDIKKENENLSINDSISDEDETYENFITNEHRVKLSSYLLQKPRARNYNPIMLCKNPDFNTRLKRLNVGFFGSSRNINLLKHCKPLTIDLSKAFESKLVNGTIYLKPHDEGVRREEKVIDNQCRQQDSVVPTAMSVQSLIDNQKVNPIFTEPRALGTVVSEKTYEDILIAERSKVINLPDISQIRRLNQRLLTAEVTPIQIRNNIVTPPTTVSGCLPTYNTTNFHNTTTNNMTTQNGTTKAVEVERNNVPLNSGISKNKPNANNVIIEDLTLKEVNVEGKLSKSVTPAPTTANIPYASTHGNKNTSNACNVIIEDLTHKEVNVERESSTSEAPEPITTHIPNESTNGNINTSPASNVVIKDLTLKEVNVDRESSKSVTPVPITTHIPNASITHGSTRSRQWNHVIDPKKKTHAPWKSREMRPSVSWLSKNKQITPPADDALLTMDTLNKMLFLLSQEKDERDVIMQKKAKEISRKSNKALSRKKGRPRKEQSDQSTQICMDDVSNDDVQIVSDANEENQSVEKQSENKQSEDKQSEDKQSENKQSEDKQSEDKKSANTQSKIKRSCKPRVRVVRTKNKRQYCCWAQEKIQTMTTGRRARRHTCMVIPCSCCCNNELQNFIINRRINKSLEQACQSIESVVQQTYSVPCVPDPGQKNITSILSYSNKPFRVIDEEESTSSDSGGIATEGKEDPSPPTAEYIDNISGGDAPPVGAEVSVSSSIDPPKVKIQISTQSGNTVNMIKQQTNKQRLVPSTSPSSRVVNIPIPEVPFQRFRYVSSKRLSIPLLPSEINTHERNIEQSSNSCQCIVPISVDSPHKKIIIDGSSTCPMHKSILPKAGSHEKQIFLTSKQISQKPAQSPIFLGKNKILLTNIKFPTELKGETNLAPQAPLVKIIPTLPLPSGVQLVLQPNGELTYNVDPNVNLDPEKLQGLPEILEAVKQQLDCMELEKGKQSKNANNITQNDEVVTLSDDETSEPNTDEQKTSKDVVSNDIPITGTAPTMATQISDNIAPDSNSTEAQKTIELTHNHTNATEEQSTAKISLDVLTEVDTDVRKDQPTENNTESNNQTITAENDAQSNSNNKDLVVAKTVDCNNEIAEEHIDSGKSKNILSDLMEMSGISAEDVTSAPVAAVQPEVVPIHPLLEQLCPQSIQSAPQTDVTPNMPASLSEFSPIMSFAELKYACMHNGLFFKLDFETGSIIPINVCIKKNGENKTVKTKVPASVTIDLTDDDVSEIKSKPPQTQSNARSLLIASQQPNIVTRITKVKPLKLFKSVHPGILRDTNDSNVYVVKNLESFKNIPQLKSIRLRMRKQELDVDARIDMVDSDCPMEEEYLESSGSDGESRKRNANDESDESSDEEPLSKVAKRMRDGDKDDETSDKPNTAAAEKTEGDKERENVSVMFDEQSEEDDDDDDCILGV